MHQSNKYIVQKIEDFRENPPTREEAFNMAVAMESSAGEIHYQRMMTGEAGSVVEKIFQKLNGDDKNHAKRIIAYMRNNNIQFFKPIED